MSTPDYYCHPIFHRDPISDVSSATGYWLVTSQEALAPGPGVYTSCSCARLREACSAVCEGVSGAGAVFFKSDLECYNAWHERCRLGEHNHPAEPQTPTRVRTQPAITACIFETLHFAVRGGETIYSDITSAFVHYQGVVDNGGNAELLATRSYMKAFYFAQGANEWTAERLALEATPETANNLPPPSSPHPRGGIVYPVTPSTVDTGAGPSEAAAEEERKRAAKATRLAAIQAGVEEKKQSGKAARRAALAAQQQQTDAQVEAQELADKQAKRMQIINEFLAATPPASTSRSNEFRAKTNLHSPSPPSSSKAAVFSPSPASNSKFKTGFQTPSKSASFKGGSPFKPAPSPMLKIGGRVVERTPKAKSKGPSDGNESDALYEALDDDLAEVLADWVDPEYRYDPMTENKPRDNA
ncbi:hypothetical protein C8F04DRAFT_1189709 [Mycena alexandri]|uniref:Uncharacterized protein n=1 Tax=Mycena alexandri TaxID=1745969 RepID=A0AAD6SHX5_9AGAR|nr:hypothetical protein C8F04DRAFT_1189709 [Mycena alexandri]